MSKPQKPPVPDPPANGDDDPLVDLLAEAFGMWMLSPPPPPAAPEPPPARPGS
jgi:hypothetical protein